MQAKKKNLFLGELLTDGDQNGKVFSSSSSYWPKTKQNKKHPISSFSQKVVVKFVKGVYPYEIHLKLAQCGLAPALYCHQKVDYLYEVVVMEFLEGENFNKGKHQTLEQQLRDAVSTLHRENLVHGDLRYPNILVVDGSIMITNNRKTQKSKSNKNKRKNQAIGL